MSPSMVVAIPRGPVPAWVGDTLGRIRSVAGADADAALLWHVDARAAVPIGGVLGSLYRRLAARATVEHDAARDIGSNATILESWRTVDMLPLDARGDATPSLLVWLPDTPPDADLARLATHGVVWIGWPAAHPAAANWPGSNAVLRNDDTNESATAPLVVWQRRTAAGAAIPLYEHALPVHEWNARLTANDTRWVACGILERVLRSAVWQSADAAAASSWVVREPQRKQASTASGSSTVARSAVAVSGVTRPLLRALAQYTVAQLRERSGGSQWRIAAHWHDASDGSTTPCLDLSRYQTLETPSSQFWADPFVALDGDRYWIFFEQMPRWSGKGTIEVVEYGPHGVIGAPRRVLERPYHLSYPFVFQDRGMWYMIPETSEARCVELYRATNFPDGWQRIGTLIDDVDAVDATLHHDGDRWWMFVTVANRNAPAWDELHLYTADDVTGPWAAHTGNPVRRSAVGSRPAGALWRDSDGVLIRPGQVCTPRYGAALRLHAVDHLSAQHFAEHAVGEVTPLPWRNMDGVHSIHRVGQLSVIDWKRRFGGR